MSFASSIRVRAAYLASATRKNAALGGFFSHGWIAAAAFFFGVAMAAIPFAHNASVELSNARAEAARQAAATGASAKAPDARGQASELKFAPRQSLGSKFAGAILAGARIIGFIFFFNALLGLKRHFEEPWKHSLATPLATLIVAGGMTFGVSLLDGPASDAKPSEPLGPEASAAMEWIGAAAMLFAAALKSWIVACGAGAGLDREAVLAEFQIRSCQLEEAEILESSTPGSAPASPRKNSL